MRLEADAVTVSVWFAWSCALLFMLGYSKLTPWWERRAGWVAALHGWAFLLLTTPLTLRYADHVNTHHAWFAWYYAASFVASGSVELLRLYLVYTLQPGGRRARP